jgi:hypothetical protein
MNLSLYKYLIHTVNIFFAGGTSVVTLSEPGFVGTLKNVTVPEGREVVLSCTVKNLDGHKVH